MQKLNLPHISLGQNFRYANSALTTQIINQHDAQNNGMSQSNQFLINNSNNVIDPEHLHSQNLRTDNFSSRAKSSDGGRFAESHTHSKNKIRMYGSKKIIAAYTTYIKQSDHISKPIGQSHSKIEKQSNKLANFERPSTTIHQSIRKKVIGSRKNISPSISYISGPGNEDKMKNFKYSKQLSKSPSLTLKESLKRESLRPKVIGRYTKISAQIDLIGDLSEIKTLKDKKQDMYHEDELDIGKLGENQQKYLRNDQSHQQSNQKNCKEKKEENIFNQKKIEKEDNEMSESKQLSGTIKIEGTYSKFLQNNKQPSVILTPTKKIRAQIDQIQQVKKGQDSSNKNYEKRPAKIYNDSKKSNANIECINQSSRQSDELLLSARLLKENSIKSKIEPEKIKQLGQKASTNSICREQLDSLQRQIVSQEIRDQERNKRSDKKITIRIGAKKSLKAVTDELKQEPHQETNKDQLSNIDHKSEKNHKFLQKNKLDEKKPSVIVTSNKNIRAYQEYIEGQKENIDRIKSSISIQKAESIKSIRQEINRILPKEQKKKSLIAQQKKTNSSNKTLTVVSSNKNINAYIQQIREPTYHQQDKIKESSSSQKSSQISQFKNIQVIFQDLPQIQKDDDRKMELDKNEREGEENNFILQEQKHDKEEIEIENHPFENQNIINRQQQLPFADISRKDTQQNEQKNQNLQSNQQVSNQVQECSTIQKKITNFENKKQHKQYSLTNEYNSTKEDTILKEEKQSAPKKTCSQQQVLNSPANILIKNDVVDVQKTASLKQTIIDKRDEQSQKEKQIDEENKQSPKNKISQTNFILKEKNNCMDKSTIDENKFVVGQKKIEKNIELKDESSKSAKTNEINRKSKAQSKQHEVIDFKATYLSKQILPEDPKEKINQIQKLQQVQLKKQPSVRNNCLKQNLNHEKNEELNDSLSPNSLIKRQTQIQLLSLTMNNQQIKPIPNKLKLEDSKNADKISGNSNKDLSQRSQINLSQKGSLKGLVRVSPRHHLKNNKLQKVSDDSKKSLQQLDTLQFEQKSHTKSKDKSLSKRPQKKKLNITNHNGQTNLVKKIGLLKFKENQEQVGVDIGRQFSLMNMKRDKQNIRNAAYQDEYETNQKSRANIKYKSELKNKKNEDVLKNHKIPSPYLDPAFNSIKIKNTIYDKKINEYEKKLISYPDAEGEWSKRQYQEKKHEVKMEQGFGWKSKGKKNLESSASKDNKIKTPFNQRQIEKLKEEYEKIKKIQEDQSARVRSNIRHQTQKIRNKEQQEEEYMNRRNAHRHEGHTKSFKFLKAHSHQFSYLYPTKQLEETEGKLNKKLKQLDKKLKRCSYNLNKNHDEVHEYISEARREVRQSEKYLAEFN